MSASPALSVPAEPPPLPPPPARSGAEAPEGGAAASSAHLGRAGPAGSCFTSAAPHATVAADHRLLSCGTHTAVHWHFAFQYPGHHTPHACPARAASRACPRVQVAQCHRQNIRSRRKPTPPRGWLSALQDSKPKCSQHPTAGPRLAVAASVVEVAGRVTQAAAPARPPRARRRLGLDGREAVGLAVAPAGAAVRAAPHRAAQPPRPQGRRVRRVQLRLPGAVRGRAAAQHTGGAGRP